MEGRASSAIHAELIMIQKHLQLRNVKVRVLSCQHEQREYSRDYATLSEGVKHKHKLIQHSNKFKNICNMSM